MGLFNDLPNYREKVASVNAVLFLAANQKSTQTSEATHWINLSGGADGVNERNLLLNNKEWVFVAVDKVASSVAGVRFKVMQYKRNGDDQEVFNGPLVEFLEKPAEGLTGKDFIYLNTAWKELTGNAFWEKDKGMKLLPMIPTNVKPETAATGKLLGYRYTHGGNQRVIAPEKGYRKNKPPFP